MHLLGLLVSRPALESGVQELGLKQKVVLPTVASQRCLLSKPSWLVVCEGWCMAGGDQCASTSVLWSAREVESQSLGSGYDAEISVRASVGCVSAGHCQGWQCHRLAQQK